MYFPKSKIIPDQYTNGNDLVYKDTNQYYAGYYHILASGKTYSGKNTTDGIPRELIFIQDRADVVDSESETYGFTPTSIFALYDFEASKLYYDNIRLKNGIDYPATSLTEPYYVTPTPKYPSFIRYFVKRVNNNSYIEIDQAQYQKIGSRDNRYNWASYLAFELPWTTGGAPGQDILITNKNIVSLTERRLKLYGFSQYITNYTQFAL